VLAATSKTAATSHAAMNLQSVATSNGAIAPSSVSSFKIDLNSSAESANGGCTRAATSTSADFTGSSGAIISNGTMQGFGNSRCACFLNLVQIIRYYDI
jgi:hypothetical protein